MLIAEYDPDLPFIIPKDEAFDADAKWFRKQLKHIGGKNDFGGQNLELRWAADYVDPMSADKKWRLARDRKCQPARRATRRR